MAQAKFSLLRGGCAVAKGMSKRAYHKKDMNKLNRTALLIGSILGAISLLAIIISFLN